MARKAPEWHPIEDPTYDVVMTAENTRLLSQLADDPALRASVLADPRDLHHALYAPFAPPTYPEYAGTYRGTLRSSLEERPMGAPSVIFPGENFGFITSKEVPAAMAQLVTDARQAMRDADGDWEKLATLAYIFAHFGLIHPFLDGNGHVQRALFAAAALEMDLPLSNRFAIHPRSYDMLLAHALESYTRLPSRRPEWLAAIAEYLAQWLAGPFDRPGSGLAPL